MTCLYDFLAPAYDPAFASIFRPFRERAFELLPRLPGAVALDLACGTGQNFPLLASRIGSRGKIIGVDISSGMLRRARRRAGKPEGSAPKAAIELLQLNAAGLTPEQLDAQTGVREVDLIVCTYGFTAMGSWEAAFANSWNLLAPGGIFLILDVDGQRRNLHTRAVEMVTRSDFSRKIWQSLRGACADFRMDYLEPSAHLFGGRLFVASGIRPPAPRTRPCPS